ncbi:MAG: hypothetical protein DRQ47_04390 [Gammaproteobacteria bacterium]|nr:MAG: hypothetical protein DRQ47_04390 [Gammaproteobacteria bacterium]
MDYDEIVALALSYADRENDTELPGKMDSFLRIVEARMNRAFKVGKMSTRASIDLSGASVDQEYFGLPSDFGGLRDIEYKSGTSRATFNYLSPEQMNAKFTANLTDTKLYYTLLANQIQIYPVSSGSGYLEIIYYQKVPALTSGDSTNWLGDNNPDAYVFGLMTEVSAFVKDKEAALLWDGRFKESLAEIENDDSSERWSGTALQTRAG